MEGAGNGGDGWEVDVGGEGAVGVSDDLSLLMMYLVVEVRVVVLTVPDDV